MIQLIQGPPRSGKSYFAVNYLVKFTTFDELYQEYVLQPEILIISNIEGLKIRHWSLSECLKGKQLEEFFSIGNFEQIMTKTRKTHIILLIDEAHEIFPNGFKSEKIYNFFAYHGHIGLDVILMTQGIESMARLFNPLLEYVVCVTQRSKAVAGAFSYTYKDLKGKYLFSKVLKKEKNVFRAYKSFRQDEHNKPKNALLRWAVVIGAFFIGGGIIFQSALGTLKDRSSQSAATAVENNRALSAPVKSLKESSTRAADPVAAPVVPDPDGIEWRMYKVQGYHLVGETYTFLINGRVIGGDRVRNFDPELMVCEFYGLPIPEAARATAPAAAGIDSGAAARLPRVEPLGETPARQVTYNFQ